MADATEFHDRLLSLGLARVSEAAALAFVAFERTDKRGNVAQGRGNAVRFLVPPGSAPPF